MTAMLVETFEVTEVDADGQIECEAEAMELIEKLGLDGQKKLLTKDTGEVSRIPYRKMTEDELFVYSAICPQIKKLHEFSDSAIPVRVLQVASHAIDLFQDVYVWSAKSADIKDPVLVGHNEINHTHEYFILARWGEVLEPLEKLVKLAAAKCRELRKAGLLKIVTECKAGLEAIDETPDAEAIRQQHSFYFSDGTRTPGRGW